MRAKILFQIIFLPGIFLMSCTERIDIELETSNLRLVVYGEITTDLDITPQTKNELGDEYNMKRVSEIGKEWDEQAKAFSEYVTGKTVDEVKGIALTEGKPAEDDLSASVSITVADFVTVIEKAYNSVN